MTSIANPRRCNTRCLVSEWGWVHAAGDVRRCGHGKIWLCVGNQNGYIWNEAGYWRRLSPVWDFFSYNKAVRVLGG